MHWQVEAIEKSTDRAALHNSAVAVLRVAGMACGSGAERVRDSLLSLPGVLAVRVELPEGMVRINFAPQRTELQQLLDAVTDAGGNGGHEYRAALVEATW